MAQDREVEKFPSHGPQLAHGDARNVLDTTPRRNLYSIWGQGGIVTIVWQAARCSPS